MVGTLAWSLIHPDDRKRVKEEFNSWVEEAQSAFDAVEFRVQHIDGSWRWLEAKAKANPEKSGFNGYLITSREITARKERQQQLELFDRVLRHNIRNDMSVICGAADTIKTNTTDDTKWFATKILEKSEDMLQMTEKQREITKILRENQEKSECDIRNMLKNLQSKMQSVHPNARITLDCPDEVILDVNERFSHALQELVENAIVHNDSDEPTVEITVSLTEEHVSIAVADDGPQIPDMEREVILNPQNRSPLYHGSGLGLWLIKLLVSRSGGKIGFVKTPQPGNTIKIDIPLSAV